MDVLITREAELGIISMNALLRPKSPAWGLLLGHKRGPRFFVERILPAGGAGEVPDIGRLEDLNRLWEERIIGLFAVRPSAAFKRVVTGPYFYGKLFVAIRPAKKGFSVKPSVVEFDRKFFLSAIPRIPRPEGGKP